MENLNQIAMLVLNIVLILVIVATVIFAMYKFKISKNGEGLLGLLKNVLKLLSETSEVVTGKNSLYSKILDEAVMLVQTAERMQEWNPEFKDLTPEQLNEKQHAYVKEAIVHILETSGIKVTETVSRLIDNAIHVAVANFLSHKPKKLE